jgi:hypothetical protein
MSQSSRRTFIKSSALFALSLPFMGIFSSALAAKKGGVKAAVKADPIPEGSTAVSTDDPVASAIGYQPDVKNINFEKYPKRKKPEAKNQFCKNCALYTVENNSWGKCQMLTSGLVHADGWCGSWSKKS